MGYMRHHGMLVTSCIDNQIELAHAKALCFLPIDLVSGMSAKQTNGYRSFAVFPDGSSEGWPESIDRDQNRREFKAWLSTQDYLEWVEVQYGDERKDTRIIADSDHPEEAKVVDAVIMLPE